MMSNFKKHILIDGEVGSKTNDAIIEKFKQELESKNLVDEVQIMITGSFGIETKATIIKILPDNTFYSLESSSQVSTIIEEHIIKNHIVHEYCISNKNVII